MKAGKGRWDSPHTGVKDPGSQTEEWRKVGLERPGDPAEKMQDRGAV